MRNFRQLITLRYERFLLSLKERPQYWRLRRRNRIWQFNLTWLTFRSRRLGSSCYSQLSALTQLVRKSAFRAIPGIALASIFSLLPHFMRSAGVEAPLLFSNVVDNDTAVVAYDGALVAIITVTGLFLSLYFTNFNTVIGTLYVDVPENIRNLLINEPVNHVATLLLTNLIVFTLITLGGAVVLNVRPVVSMILALVVGLLAVPMFAYVARRTLSFFNPTYLVRSIVAELDAALREVVSTSPVAHDPSIQDYRMRFANAEARKLRSLGRIVAEKRHLRRDSLTPLVGVALDFLAVYLRRKRQIPIDSAWYAKRERHKYWYLADPNETLLALNTYTSLQPEQSPDFLWLESTLLTFFEDIFQSLLDDSDYLVAAEAVRASHVAFGGLGAEHQIDAAAKSVLALSQSLHSNLAAQEPTLSRTTPTEQLQLISDIGSLPITILLSFFKPLRTLDIAALMGEVQEIDWRDGKNLYARGFPTYMLSNLDYLRNRIEFEFEIEGEIVSAPWYVCQLAAHPVAESLKNQLTALLDLGRECYVTQSSNLIDAEMHGAAMLLIAYGLEYCHKLEHHSEVLFEKMRIIEGYRILKELPFAEIDDQVTLQEIAGKKRELIINVAKCIPNLSDDDFFSNDDTLDLLGQAVKTLGEEYFKALESGDGELASLIFQSYFPGVLAARDAVVAETSDWQPPQNIRFIGEPISDLLALSGYAYLFSELHQERSLWDSCVKIWNQHLDDSEINRSLLAMVKLVALARKSITLFVYSFTRSNWQQCFERTLKDLPLSPMGNRGGRLAFQSYVRRHPSLCIRAVAPAENFHSMVYDPEDVFVDMYLAEKLELDKSQWLGYLNLGKAMEDQRELEARYEFRLDNLAGAADAD